MTSFTLRLSAALLLSALGQTAANAQAYQRRPPSSAVIFELAAPSPLAQASLRDTTDSIPRQIRPTHWKEGALIGGLALGATFALLAPGFCALGDNSSCGGAAVAGFLGGAVIGGLIGALIGGQFPKEEKPADPERPE
jgi:hypothetical protein